MLAGKKILLTGGAGFLGRFVAAELVRRGLRREDLRIPRKAELDLRVLEDCETAVAGVEIVIHLAARVGGIGFNRRCPGELFYDNAIMGIQLMETARRAQVGESVQVGTVCAYPKRTRVPFREEDLWGGYPEETNAPYGLAKKSLLVMAQAYRARRLQRRHPLPSTSTALTTTSTSGFARHPRPGPQVRQGRRPRGRGQGLANGSAARDACSSPTTPPRRTEATTKAPVDVGSVRASPSAT